MAKMLKTILERLGFSKKHEEIIERSEVAMVVLNHNMEGEPVSETVTLKDGTNYTIPLYVVRRG